MRFAPLAAALLLAAGPAFAQTTAPAATETAPAAAAPAPGTSTTTTSTTTTEAMPASKKHMSVKDRFDAADTNHDGQLSKEEAEAADWKMVTKNFSAIDTENKGSVTLEQIKAYHHGRKHGHKKSAE